jgi:thiamine-monophosphate kinase
MPPGEFELIERYFRAPAVAGGVRRGDVPLGIGDDAAVLDVPAGRQLVAALDALVEGRHFPRGAPARSIGHRALAANLSDLAAMGATPAWFLLSLTMPAVDEQFLAEFAAGMLALAGRHGVALVGGDTTGGPLVVSVQALGTIAPGAALTRAGARAGDLVFVSGTPGEEAAAAAQAREQHEQRPARA